MLIWRANYHGQSIDLFIKGTFERMGRICLQLSKTKSSGDIGSLKLSLKTVSNRLGELKADGAKSCVLPLAVCHQRSPGTAALSYVVLPPN